MYVEVQAVHADFPVLARTFSYNSNTGSKVMMYWPRKESTL